MICRHAHRGSFRQVLQRTFGLSDFRPGQLEVIHHLLAGRSAAAMFPTSGGKSLCYQLPGCCWRD